VQKAAIKGLKAFSGDAAASSLAPLLRNSDSAVRVQAAQVLQVLNWRPPTREDEMWYGAARGQVSSLVAFGDAAIPALELLSHSPSYNTAIGAIQTMGDIGGNAVLKPLVSALHSPEAAIVVAAVEALGKIGGEEVVVPLLGALRHTSGQVRVTAVEGLGGLRAPAALEPLRHALTDPVWEVRKTAAETLGRIIDVGALEPLAHALSDSDSDVREAAAMALGRLANRKAIEQLVMALKDSTSGVRRIAAASLSRIDGDWTSSPEAQAAFEKLKPALDDDDPEVRHFVSHLLSGVGIVTNAFEPPMAPQPAPSVPKERLHKLAVSLFLAILCDSDRDLRQAAAEALGRLADRRAEGPLVRALGDSDSGVRQAAEQALRSFGGKAAQAAPP
jgi:HEAT repeat protein